MVSEHSNMFHAPESLKILLLLNLHFLNERKKECCEVLSEFCH